MRDSSTRPVVGVSLTVGDVPAFAVGLVVSFASALVVTRVLLRYVARHSFVRFAWYRIIAGSALLVALSSGPG